MGLFSRFYSGAAEGCAARGRFDSTIPTNPPAGLVANCGNIAATTGPSVRQEWQPPMKNGARRVLLVLQRVAAIRLLPWDMVWYSVVTAGPSNSIRCVRFRDGRSCAVSFAPARPMRSPIRRSRSARPRRRSGRACAHHRSASRMVMPSSMPAAGRYRARDAQLQFAAEWVKGLCRQPRLDFPEPIVAQKPSHSTERVCMGARFVLFSGHQFVSCIDASLQPNLTIISARAPIATAWS